ncbi:MAG: type II toxin-antitoxin system PemK/MazF family toxin [Pyrinomonadaceae bacterium]
MKEGDVVIVAMPQAKGTTKNRPTIIPREMPPFQDMLVCGVSTQLHQEVKDFDETIAPTDSGFVASSLVGKSLIRLGFLTVVPQSQIVSVIGSVSSTRHRRLLDRRG